MREILKLTLLLALFCALSAGVLAFVSTRTEEARAGVAEARRLDAARRVLHLADGETFREDEALGVFVAEKDGRIVKAAVECGSPNGYGGPIRAMVSATTDGRVLDFAVLEASETPGLGAKIGSKDFAKRLGGMPLSSDWRVKRDGGDVDAVTSATISSRAACEAVASAAGRLKQIVDSR